MGGADPDVQAFPVPGLSNLPNGDYIHPEFGMTLRQYAAIKLGVPDSGTDWLDEMIRTAARDRMAGLAMQAIVSSIANEGDYQRLRALADETGLSVSGWIARDAYKQSDAMLKAREEKEPSAQAQAADPLLSSPVGDLGLSTRCINCLKAEGIHNIGELIQKTEMHIASLPNLGRKSKNEIKEALSSRGLALIPGWGGMETEHG